MVGFKTAVRLLCWKENPCNPSVPKLSKHFYRKLCNLAVIEGNKYNVGFHRKFLFGSIKILPSRIRKRSAKIQL